MLPPSDVTVLKVVFRERINRFALPFPVLRACPGMVLVLRQGQVGGDAVSDAVAHNAVTAAVGADQLVPGIRGQPQK